MEPLILLSDSDSVHYHVNTNEEFDKYWPNMDANQTQSQHGRNFQKFISIMKLLKVIKILITIAAAILLVLVLLKHLHLNERRVFGFGRPGLIVATGGQEANKTNTFDTTTEPKNESFYEKINEENKHRRDFVRQMTLSAWNAYRRYTWGQEAVSPNKLKYPRQYPSHYHAFGRNSGRTILASMSTLWVMGLTNEFAQGKAWIEKELNFSDKIEVDTVRVYETVTEYIGGLLSAYALSGDTMFVDKAKEIADFIQPAYNINESSTVNNLEIPPQKYNFIKSRASSVPFAPQSFNGGLALEYIYLSALTGSLEYKNRAYANRRHYMTFRESARYLDELLKCHLQSNGADLDALRMYQNEIARVLQGVAHTQSSNLTYIQLGGNMNGRMDFSQCFFGSMLTLGAHALSTSLPKDQTESNIHAVEWQKLMAEQITKTCHRSASATKTGLSPDIVVQGGDLVTNGHYSLRPELAESYFILWRLTHKPEYRERAWQMAQAIERHCKSENGAYTPLWEVNQLPAKRDQLNDLQPAVFLSGTLKYLYLIFTDDEVVSLDKWIFNAVGHPLPVCGKNPRYPHEFCKKQSAGFVIM